MRILLIFHLLILISSPLNILVYSPRMMESHVNFMARIANILAENGHRVTVIDSVLRGNIGNGLSGKIERIIEVAPSGKVTEFLEIGNLPKLVWSATPTPEYQKKLMSGLGKLHGLQCAHLVQNSSTVEQIRGAQFDVLIHEVFDACGIGIFGAGAIRTSVVVSSTGLMDVVPWALGISHPLYAPSLLSDHGNTIGWSQVYRSLKFQDAMISFYEIQQEMIAPLYRSKYGVMDPFLKILRKTSILLTNTHEMSETYRPFGRRIFEIAGIAFKDPTPLDEEYTSLVSTNSPIVLISFGTAATSWEMPEKIKNSLVRATQHLPNVTFLWKYEREDELTNKNISNIIFRRFIPQMDLLGSGKISLFITHCGQNSLLESLWSGTRILAVPLFGDQLRNARGAHESELLEILPKLSLEDPQRIVAAIRRGLIPNERIDKNLRRISMIFKNARVESEDLLLKMIDKNFGNLEIQPMNFEHFPVFWHPRTFMLIFDCIFYGFLTILLVIFLNFLINWIKQ